MPRIARKDKPAVSSKPSLQPRKAQSNDEWAGFVPLEIGLDEKSAFDAWFNGDTDQVWREVEDALAVGLKFTLTFDMANNCFVASFSGRPDIAGAIEFNAILTARSGLAWEAIALLTYKHCSLLQADWWAQLNKPKQNRMQFG